MERSENFAGDSYSNCSEYSPRSEYQMMETTSVGICRYFLQGYCSRGDRCLYAHVTNLAQVQNQRMFTGMAHNINKSPSFVTSLPKYQSYQKLMPPREDDDSMTCLKKGFGRYSSSYLSDVVGQIYFLSKDQYGCRYLQKQIEELKEEAISYILPEIFHQIVEIMTG